MCTRSIAARIVGMVVAASVITTFDEPEAHTQDFDSSGKIFAEDPVVAGGSESLETIAKTLVFIYFAGAITGVGDLILTGSDLVYLARETPQPKGWAVAKVAIGVPQVLFYNGLAGYAAQKDGSDGGVIAATLAGGYTGSLTANGIWALAQKSDPASVYGFSWALGMNTAFTSTAVGALFGQQWLSRGFGIVEMMATGPSIAVSAVRLADPTSERMAWGALLAWSGVLFTHGLVSAVHGTKVTSHTDHSWRKWNAPRIGLAPTVVSDGRLRGPGLAIGGFF